MALSRPNPGRSHRRNGGCGPSRRPDEGRRTTSQPMTCTGVRGRSRLGSGPCPTASRHYDSCPAETTGGVTSRCRPVTYRDVEHYCKRVLAIVSGGGALSRHGITQRRQSRRVPARAAPHCAAVAAAARRCRRGVQSVSQPDRARAAQAERGGAAAGRQGAADLRGDPVRAGRDSGRAGAGGAGDAGGHPGRSVASTSGRSRCCCRSTSPSARRTGSRSGPADTDDASGLSADGTDADTASKPSPPSN